MEVGWSCFIDKGFENSASFKSGKKFIRGLCEVSQAPRTRLCQQNASRFVARSLNLHLKGLLLADPAFLKPRASYSPRQIGPLEE